MNDTHKWDPKAQRHHCFSLSPQPRDGGPLRQWGGANETPGPVQRHARPYPQHLTPPQAHLPRGRTWDSAGLGMWIVTAVTCICSQSSESKTCWCCAFYLAFACSPARPWKIKLPLRPLSSSQNLQMQIMQIRIPDLAPNRVTLWLIIWWRPWKYSQVNYELPEAS